VSPPPASGPVRSFSEVVLVAGARTRRPSAEIETGERVGTAGRSAVYDCFGCEVKRVLFKLSGERNEPWTSSKPGSLGIGVVAVFVERAPVTGEIQLLMNIDALIRKTLRPQLLRREIRR